MTTLYRLFNADNQLLYIGIADHWPRRINDHAHDKPWWPEVATTTVEHFPNRETAVAAETQAIRTEHPRHNVTHNTKPPRRPAKTYPINWPCAICHTHIDNGDGYLEAPRLTHIWWFVHRRCDPNIDSGSYWIAIERIRTTTAIQEWEDHLAGKRWMEWVSWQEAIATARIKTP